MTSLRIARAIAAELEPTIGTVDCDCGGAAPVKEQPRSTPVEEQPRPGERAAPVIQVGSGPSLAR